jgi:replicative DNA helicase
VSDLKESGNIEEDSHAVILVFRPGHYRGKVPRYKHANPGIMWLLVGKNRDGPTPSLAAAWDDDRGQVLGMLDKNDYPEENAA